MKRARSAARGVVWAVSIGLLAVMSVAKGAPGDTSRVSVDSSGVQANGPSWDLLPRYLGTPCINADGRYVAFPSDASNLVANDTNARTDVFVHDRQTGLTTRVSVDSSGAQGNSESGSCAISEDGRYVAFGSLASNLVANDTNARRDVFVHDRQTGLTTRVSVDSSGAQGNSSSDQPSISADGRYVAFESDASNLVANDTNARRDVFVHDRQTGLTTRVSIDSGGAQGNDSSDHSSISADSRYVAFGSRADNLVPGDTNERKDFFVHDRQTGLTTRVNVDSSTAQSDGESEDTWPVISADGRYVAFESQASNLVANDTNGVDDIFVRDRQTGLTTRVSVDSSGAQGNSSSDQPSISADGRYVAFRSFSSNLVANDTNGVDDFFVHDRRTGLTTRVSVDSGGAQSNAKSWPSPRAVSANGRYVAFPSNASNLVANDTNGVTDIFVHERPVDSPPPTDSDGDGVPDASDNCPAVSNPAQTDTDGDGIGDTCDTDIDGDGMSNDFESTYGLNPYDPADAAVDSDLDGLTNLQESRVGTNPSRADTDGDGYADGTDNCPTVANDQADSDGDDVGDACDVTTGAPELSVYAASPLDFGTTQEGQPGQQQEFTVVNTGEGRLVGSCATESPFFVRSPAGCAFDLLPGHSRTFVVDFIPVGPILASPVLIYGGSLRVESNGGSAALQLVGRGLPGPSDPSSPVHGPSTIWGLFIGVRLAGDALRGDLQATELRQTIISSLGAYAPRFRLLASGSSELPTRQNVKTGIEEQIEQMRDGDTLILYFGAHGDDSCRVGYEKDGSPILDCTKQPDALLKDEDNSFTRGDEAILIEDGYLYDDELLEWLRNALAMHPNKKIEIWSFMDMCFSGGFWGKPAASDAGDLSQLPRIGFLASAPEGALGWYQAARLRSDYGRSFFGTALIEAFTKSDSGRLAADTSPYDDSLTLGEIYRYVYDAGTEAQLRRKGDVVGLTPLSSEAIVMEADAPGVVPAWYQSSDFVGVLTGSPITDSDEDGVMDDVDNCPNVPNVDQRDSNGDGIGDACDATPPAISPSVSGTRGSNDWYTGDVSVSWSVTDEESAVTSAVGCGVEAVSADTGGQTFSCTAASAGGTTTVSVTVKRDATPPTLTFGAPSPAANASGWHKGGVEIPYTAEDATSGVASAEPGSPVAVAMQGSGVTRTVTVTDNAGNSAAFTTSPVNIDGTVPAISISSPSDGATYLRDGQLLAGYSCSDAVSGIARCEGAVANGAPVDTSRDGEFTFTVNAEDQAGNTNTKTHRYTIGTRYSFGGFYWPVKNPPTVNLMKAGWLVPLRWSLLDGSGKYVSSLKTFKSVSSRAVSCQSGLPGAAIGESQSSGTQRLVYNPITKKFVYLWKTAASWKGTCRVMTLELSDGQKREALFRFN